MWVHNIDPVLFRIGFLEIRYYGLIYLLGILLGFLVLNYYRKKGKIELSKDELYDFVFWITAGVIVGARIFEIIFFEPGYYFSNPLKMFAIWEGGLSFHGGLVGALIAGYLFCKKKKIDFWKAADILAAPAVLALAFGRIANFINGELWGTVSNARWCVVFPRAGDACRHPWQIYAAAKRFLVFGFLVWLNRRAWSKGFIFWNFVFFDGLGRFLLDFWREEAVYLGLTMGQWLSVVMVVVALYFFKKNHKEDWKKIFH